MPVEVEGCESLKSLPPKEAMVALTVRPILPAWVAVTLILILGLDVVVVKGLLDVFEVVGVGVELERRDKAVVVEGGFDDDLKLSWRRA